MNGHIQAQVWSCNLRPWGCPVATQLTEPFLLPRVRMLAQTAVNDLVWVHGPATAGVYADICGWCLLTKP